MATTQDIQRLKDEFDEHIHTLQNSFGVVETDINKLASFTHDFQFASLDEHQHDDNDLRQVGKDAHDKCTAFVTAVNGETEQLNANLQKLHELLTSAPGNLDQHVQQHAAGHQELQHATQEMGGALDQAHTEFDQTHNEYLQHVQQMRGVMQTLTDKLYGSAGHFDESIRSTQMVHVEKAATELQALIDSHAHGHIPSEFEQAGTQLGTLTHNLGEHAKTAQTNMQHEIETMMKELKEYAEHKFEDQVHAAINKLIHETLTWVMQEMIETTTVVTVGVTTTTAMSPFIPELAILKKALDGIKEAIKVFKTLADIF
jgi:uncharacterized phage infection (PIP) family protein YhgE